MPDKRMSRAELERVLHYHALALIGVIAAVWVLAAALFRKGVLSPKDLLADA